MNLDFNGFGFGAVTLAGLTAAAEGKPVKLASSAMAALCVNGDAIDGVALLAEADGCANVQMSGYVCLPYTGAAPAVGRTALSANGTGGVKADAAGVIFRVLTVDTSSKTVGFIL